MTTQRYMYSHDKLLVYQHREALSYKKYLAYEQVAFPAINFSFLQIFEDSSVYFTAFLRNIRRFAPPLRCGVAAPAENPDSWGGGLVGYPGHRAIVKIRFKSEEAKH